MDRPKCVVCGEEQTDVVFLCVMRYSIGFPVCDQHTLVDLTPDQYVVDQIILEVA